MQLDDVVPWGRSYAEYCAMFNLSSPVKGKVLSVADGPSSFNAEATTLGSNITSCDPLYQYDADAIAQRIDEVYPVVMAQVEQHQAQFIWSSITSPTALGQQRMASMQQFLDDYPINSERYIAASLPNIPFYDQQFDLALCSHFLFLYSEQFDEAFHLQAIQALCRAAKEVRIYPLITLDNSLSPHLESVMTWLISNEYHAEQIAVDYAFQKGATHMLRITKHD